MADISRYIIQYSLHLSGFFQVSNAYFLVSSWILSQFIYYNLNVVEGLAKSSKETIDFCEKLNNEHIVSTVSEGKQTADQYNKL